MLPETLERIHALITQGATVVANAPKSIATLAGGQQAQQRFDQAVSAIWGQANSGSITNIGKGRLISGASLEEAIQKLGIKPDVQGEIRWLHRKTEGADWYFITPKKQEAFNGKVQFSAEGSAELWNPVTGEIKLLNVERKDGYAIAKIEMPKAGSYFVVFHHNKKQEKVEEVVYNHAQIIESPWTVQFPAGWGASAELKIDKLMPWCDMPMSDEGKAFSGSAIYTTTFIVPAEAKQLMLDLGKVSMIAEVKLNGQKLRTLWCTPYALDITDYTQTSENTLEIKVTSTWFNRLVYDASLSEADRKTWTISGPDAGSALKEYGLLGPVQLRY